MSPLRSIVKKIFVKSLESISPSTLVKNALHRDGNRLVINGFVYDMKKNVYVVGFGKAVYGMAMGLQDVLQNHIIQGIISIPNNEKTTAYAKTTTNVINQTKASMLHNNITVRRGAENNLPDEDAVENAKQIKNLVASLKASDILIVLISGGGSALLPAPVMEITLQEKLETIKMVANSGGTIQQLNTIRKKLSYLKGGKLASLCHAECIASLVISDIVGDPLDLIASGPTVLDTSTFADCQSIFRDLKIADKIPKSVENYIDRKKKEEIAISKKCEEAHLQLSTEPDDSLLSAKCSSPHIDKCNNYIVGSNKILVDAIVNEVLSYDFKPIVITTTLEGLAEKIGFIFADLAFYIFSKQKLKVTESLSKLCPEYSLTESELSVLFSTNKLCFITAGETTVNVKSDEKGGRNQHLVLAALSRFKELSCNSPDVHLNDLCLLSAGSDGQDGPTDAAGALCTSDMIDYVIRNDIDVNESLRRCASYGFFEKHLNGEGLVKTGLTGTNVMDVQMLWISSVPQE